MIQENYITLWHDNVQSWQLTIGNDGKTFKLDNWQEVPSSLLAKAKVRTPWWLWSG